MLPVECLSRAVVRVMHSHPHLSGKKDLVTFDISTDARLQEGPQCGVVALVVATGVMREEDILDDKVMDLGH